MAQNKCTKIAPLANGTKDYLRYILRVTQCTTLSCSVAPFFPFSLVAAPLKMVFPQKGPLFFSRVTEQLSCFILLVLSRECVGMNPKTIQRVVSYVIVSSFCELLVLPEKPTAATERLFPAGGRRGRRRGRLGRFTRGSWRVGTLQVEDINSRNVHWLKRCFFFHFLSDKLLLHICPIRLYRLCDSVFWLK